jgi:hypothetical protein
MTDAEAVAPCSRRVTRIASPKVVRVRITAVMAVEGRARSCLLQPPLHEPFGSRLDFGAAVEAANRIGLRFSGPSPGE